MLYWPSVQEEQLKCHESKLKQISLEVEEHKRNPPELTPKSKESEEYRIKEHYLTYEVSSMLKHLCYISSNVLMSYNPQNPVFLNTFAVCPAYIHNQFVCVSVQKSRYETYINLLQAKLSVGSDDLDKIEASVFSGDSRDSHMRKTQSSPSISHAHGLNGQTAHKDTSDSPN